MCKLLATLPGAAYIARVPLSAPKHLRTARKHMRKAIRAQLENKGFAMVEALAACPVQWHMEPMAALKHVDETVVKTFEPGVFADRVGEPGE
jgi:2-oxoglutarate ferredoxin oxidoreductase subunit beta